jgi:hypothetical protein
MTGGAVSESCTGEGMLGAALDGGRRLAGVTTAAERDATASSADPSEIDIDDDDDDAVPDDDDEGDGGDGEEVEEGDQEPTMLQAEEAKAGRVPSPEPDIIVFRGMGPGAPPKRRSLALPPPKSG